MTRYMLDTNTVSHLVRGHAAVAGRVVATPMASLCISAVTEGELMFGLAKRPGAAQLHRVVSEFLKRVESLAWDSAAAERYGRLRAGLEALGRPLGPLDMLIAAHASSAGTVLVTADRAFGQVSGLQVEDWTH